MFRNGFGKYFNWLGVLFNFEAMFFGGIAALIVFGIGSCTADNIKWSTKTIVDIIGPENLKLNEQGKWVGSNNPNVKIDFSKQPTVFRVVFDGPKVIIYTKDKNYISEVDRDCECDSNRNNSSRNRIRFTKNVYEVEVTRKDDVKKHYVCSSQYGTCLPYYNEK
jgi:hypothetical protein